MNDGIKEAINFYNLDSNYTLEDLKKVRSQYIKENSNITFETFNMLKSSDTYYKKLLEKIINQEEIFKEEVFDLEKRLVFYTKPNGKFNDLSEKYLIKLQYIKNIEDLHNLEKAYYDEVDFVLGMKNKKKKGKKTNQKDYLNKEKEAFDIKLEQDNLEAKIKETREIINRYREDLKRINNLKDMLKLEDKYKQETSNLETEKSDTILQQKKYELLNELKLLINIPNNNLFKELNKYENLINSATNLSELEKNYENFLKDYRDLTKKNIKYVKELKKSLKKLLEEKFKSSGSKDIEFLRELLFKIEIVDEDEIYKLLSLIDNITFLNQEDKEILKEFPPLIYIHKYNGDIVSVTRKDDTNIRFYSLMKHDYFEMLNDRFEYNFLSLKSFLRHGEYVGNRNVELLDNKGKKIGIRFPNQELIYYYDEIMLAFEHTDIKDSFYFYPASNFKLNPNAKWHYNNTINKMGVAGDLFQNEEYLYQKIVENIQGKVNQEIEVENSKKR